MGKSCFNCCEWKRKYKELQGTVDDLRKELKNIRKRTNRTGETFVMNNGIEATIIEYDNTRNVSVIFKNGSIVKTTYGNLIRGNIKCPMSIEYIDDYCKITNLNTITKTEFIIDPEDLERVMNQCRYWSKDTAGYIVSKPSQKEKTVKLHRFILEPKENEIVDHINGERSDCRKSNLRICTVSENAKNQITQYNNKSGYKGVFWNKAQNKWRAKICVDYNRIHLGDYDDIIKAAKAYNEAAIIYHGEFAKLNEISD